MARKKSAKKPSRSSKKAARKGARKSGSRPAKGPVPVSSGRGASPAEIGAEVVQMIRASAGDPAIWARHWHNQCESVEGGKTAMAWRGMKQIKAKSDWWNQDLEHTIEEAVRVVEGERAKRRGRDTFQG